MKFKFCKDAGFPLFFVVFFCGENLSFSFIFPQFDWEDNGVPIRQGIHIEWQRTGDNGDAGEMIFAWSDTRTSDREVYAQKFNSNGEKQWGENGVLVVLTRREHHFRDPGGLGAGGSLGAAGQTP